MDNIPKTPPDNLEEHPRYRYVARIFMDSGFEPGEHIEQNWFYDHLEFKDMRDDSPPLVPWELRKRQAQFATAMGGLRTTLLEEYAVDLDKLDGFGWQWVLPEETTKLAMKEYERGVKREFQKVIGRLHYGSRDGLTQEQDAERADALCRVSWLLEQFRKSKKLDFSGEPKSLPPSDDEN